MRLAFDWVGMVVGHWYVVEEVDKSPHERPHRRYRCASRCGALAVHTAGTLGKGAPATCAACRGPVPDRTAVVLSEGEVSKLFEGPKVSLSVNEKNLISRAAIRDWRKFASPLLHDLVDRTATTGMPWTAAVRDAHTKNVHGKASSVQFRESVANHRRVTLVVMARGADYNYDVDLYPPRDLAFDVALARIHGAIQDQEARAVSGRRPADPVADPSPPPAAVPVAAPPPEPSAAPAQATVSDLDSGIGRLEKLRGTLEAVIGVSYHAKALREKQVAVAAKVAEAEAKARPLLNAAEDAERGAEETRQAASVAEAELDHLNKQMESLKRAIATAASEVADRRARHQTAQAQRDAAVEAAKAPKADLELARMELDELGQQERDRVAAIGQAGDLATLLAALERIGDTKPAAAGGEGRVA